MSNTQKKNVPELRFPEFEGKWEEKQLGEVAKIYDGTHQTPKYTNEGIKFLSVENIKTLNSSKYISEEAFEKEFKIRPEFGDILMTRIGDIGTPNIVSSNEKFAYYVSLALLKTKNLNSYFLKNLILSSSIQNELWRKTLHVAFPKKINKNEIGKIKINYPKKQEQQKIGQFFSKLDRQIELEEQKLELLLQQKKGYMQKIFSQELRFKDENGEDYPEWEEKKMGEITTMFSGGTPQSTNTRYYKGDIPFIRSGEISKTYTELKINEEALNNSSAKLVEVGDLLYALYGATSGEVAISKINGAINQAVLCIRTNESVEFLLNYLFFSKNKILNTFIQGGQGNLSAKIIKNLIIETPTIIEQRKIADFFCNIDNSIEIQGRKLEFLKQRKQSLLQKMFV
ncbi:restriction endonuclease subunit S [Staphylococcus sp. SS60]|nr:restriction endonuclease subunit S [Staphylococcus singaporensis]